MDTNRQNDDLSGPRGLRNGVLFSAALWLVLGMACSAFAQNTTSQAGAQSGSIADAAAGASSGSAAVIQQTFQSGNPNTRNIVGYEGSFRQDYRATIRNTPDAYAPNVSGGTNSCLVGMSGAGSVAGFGFGLGGNWSDPDCERRQLAALAHNTGQPQLAQEVLCGSAAVREARIRLGQPCIADVPRQQVVAAATPVVQAAPLVQVIGGGATPPARATNTVPDWCLTASVQERRGRAECNGMTGRR